ncbi:hypothetical protein LLG96_02165 [bacterium]|nr:hypothetical protein [bacterium]
MPRELTEKQLEFGRKLGLNLEQSSFRVALARINDLIFKEFVGEAPRKPSLNQIKLCKKFGVDVSTESAKVAEAMVQDILENLNIESVRTQDLKFGDIVKNRHDSIQRHYVISSIDDSGIVTFQGSDKEKAPARNLIKIGKK